MADWVAVSVDIADDPRVGAFAKAIHVHRDSAAMRLVQLWGRMARHEIEDGDLSRIDDATLESWAGWHKKKGNFAEKFRAFFCESGVVRGWWEWNGRGLAKARKAREHMRLKRYGANPALANSEATVDSLLDGYTEPNRTEPTNTTQREVPEMYATVVSRMQREPDRWAVVEFLESLPSGEDPAAWAKCMADYLGGFDMPGGRPAPAEALAGTCRDFRTKRPHEKNVRFFRRCLIAYMRDAVKDTSPPPGKSAGTSERTLQSAERGMRRGPPEAA